jgi:hypothetical protein
MCVPAGNGDFDLDDATNPQVYPAVLPEVICVGATNKDHKRCTVCDWGYSHNGRNERRGSNYGWFLDVMAPSAGGDFVTGEGEGEGEGEYYEAVQLGPYSANIPEQYYDGNPGNYVSHYGPFYLAVSSGTSTAFPHASGLAALLLTVNPKLSPAEVQFIMSWTATHLAYAEESGNFRTPSGSDHEVGTEWNMVLHPAAVGGPRNQQTGWGLINAEDAVTWALKSRWAVSNQYGRHIMSIDSEGNFVIDGNVKTEASADAGGPLDSVTVIPGEFMVRTADGTILARLDPRWSPLDMNGAVWPTLYLKGDLVYSQGESMPAPPGQSFVIKAADDQVMACIPSQDIEIEGQTTIPAGSLVVRGQAFIGANPDPEAPHPRFLFSDEFSGTFPGEPTSYSQTWYGDTPPQWVIVSGESNWSASWGVLKNYGSSANNTMVVIPITPSGEGEGEGEGENIEINFDFIFNTVNVPAAGIAFHVTEEHGFLYVRIDPVNNTLSVRRSDSESFVTPNPPPACPFGPGTWYEMHILWARTKVAVWYRERDNTVDPNTHEGQLWTVAFKTDENPSGVQPNLPEVEGAGRYIGLGAEHTTLTGSIWYFDNVTVSMRSPNPPSP